MDCVICGVGLVGRQRKFCSNICKCRETNHKYQNYEAQKKRALERKLWFIDMLGGKCCKCGYVRNHASLVFHHVDPSKKRFKLDARSLANRSLEESLKELGNCVLLCANCHGEEHHSECIMD